jgi:metallo-beta-lactamase class B
MELTLLHHPGHTKGSSSYLFTVKDQKRSYKVLIANMPSVIVDSFAQVQATYPNIVADYTETYAEMEGLNFDLWLAAHASQMDLQEIYHPAKGYQPEVFGDKNKYLEELKKWKVGYEEKLKGKSSQ